MNDVISIRIIMTDGIPIPNAIVVYSLAVELAIFYKIVMAVKSCRSFDIAVANDKAIVACILVGLAIPNIFA